jgi:hypothetical protein
MTAAGIREAQTKLNDRVLGKPGIEGTAISRSGGKACLKVYISDPKAETVIPKKVAGFPVVVEASGTFRKL